MEKAVSWSVFIRNFSFLFLLTCVSGFGGYGREPWMGTGVFPQNTLEKSILSVGKPIERELKGGEAQTYLLSLEKGEFFHLIVEQKGIDVVVSVFDPDHALQVEMDSPNGPLGPEPVFWVANKSGLYEIEIKSGGKRVQPGKYEVKLITKQTANSQDHLKVAAQSLFLEAGVLESEQTRAAFTKAIGKYEEALNGYLALEDLPRQGQILGALGKLFLELGNRKKGLECFEQGLKISRQINDKDTEAFFVTILGLNWARAGEKQKALENFETAIQLRQRTGNKVGEAVAYVNIGSLYLNWGEYQKAIDFLLPAIPIFKGTNAIDQEAVGYSQIGWAYFHLGENQKALEALEQALRLQHALRRQTEEAQALASIGWVFLNLGENTKALQYFEQALSLQRSTELHEGEAFILSGLGTLLTQTGEYQKANDYLEQALKIRQQAGQQAFSTFILNNLGLNLLQLGEYQKALDCLFQSLTINRKLEKQSLAAINLSLIGKAYFQLKQFDNARKYLTEALELSKKTGEAEGLLGASYGLAQLAFHEKNYKECIAQVEGAVSVLETIRTKIISPEYRSTFLGSKQSIYQLYIESLMQLHQLDPERGFQTQAFEVAEQARGRGLLDLLTEAQIELRKNIDPDLFNQERRTLQLLAGKNETLLLELSPNSTKTQELTKEINQLTIDLERIRTKIRTENPQYAALTQPKKLPAKAIQSQMLDQETILLEYLLGDENSYVWLVDQVTVSSFIIPGRKVIEAAAQEFTERISGVRSGNHQELEAASRRLSELLLSPVSGQLGTKRLLIVPDGILFYVPFAALSIPDRQTSPTSNPAQSFQVSKGSNPEPLMVNHEIIVLPSASTLVTLREENIQRMPPPKTLAVLADPVFDSTDPRLKQSGFVASSTTQQSIINFPTGSETRRSVKLREWLESNPKTRLYLTRLENAQREAQAILALVPATKRTALFGFAVNRDAVTNPKLGQHRIVHFATHGFVNSDQPELSGIVLSLLDEQGRKKPGFLLTPDIFNLNLPVDLVVLAACETGVGKLVKGEGVVGLTRGFMYAGAQRIVTSLWSVGDRETAQLMKRFYRAMLKEKLSPAAALRQAQIQLWKQPSLNHPYNWSGFVLQGEYR